MVAIDPSSGDVKALVGGRNYAESPFDRAVNGLRQPGSSFKPFVYAAALMDSLPRQRDYSRHGDRHRIRRSALPPAQLGRQVPRRHHVARGAHALAQSGRSAALAEVRRRFHCCARATLWHRRRRSRLSRERDRRIGRAAARFCRCVHGFCEPRHACEPRFVYRVEDASGKTRMVAGVRARCRRR